MKLQQSYYAHRAEKLTDELKELYRRRIEYIFKNIISTKELYKGDINKAQEIISLNQKIKEREKEIKKNATISFLIGNELEEYQQGFLNRYFLSCLIEEFLGTKSWIGFRNLYASSLEMIMRIQNSKPITRKIIDNVINSKNELAHI